jgi:hypothetical protein
MRYGLVVRQKSSHGSILGEVWILEDFGIRFIFKLHDKNTIEGPLRSSGKGRCESALKESQEGNGNFQLHLRTDRKSLGGRDIKTQAVGNRDVSRKTENVGGDVAYLLLGVRH